MGRNCRQAGGPLTSEAAGFWMALQLHLLCTLDHSELGLLVISVNSISVSSRNAVKTRRTGKENIQRVCVVKVLDYFL